MRVRFYLRYKTSFGQSLWINFFDGLEPDSAEKIISLSYLNGEYWFVELKIRKNQSSRIEYKYILKNEDGDMIPESGNDRSADIPPHGIRELLIIDTWNHAGEYENVFYSTPFQKIFLRQRNSKEKDISEKKDTHIFKVKAPLLQKKEVVCFAGNCDALGNWNTEKPIMFSKKGNWWICSINLTDENFPIAYKYGIYNTRDKKFIGFESGDNRVLHNEAAKKKLIVLHDGFTRFPNNTWKGAGVAIPVFSLRSKKSFGVGEFTDLKLLADWAKASGLKLIQILPVNDTIATNSWADSYPYAAISAFALHPLYINLEKAAGKKLASKIKLLAPRQKELNALPDVDYVEVMKTKLDALKDIYTDTSDDFFESTEYLDFFKRNNHWLIPYAAFCFLRDKYATSDYTQWGTHSVYNKEEIENLCSDAHKEIAFYYFVQFHLHCQLREASDYIHKKGIALKGDIAIGVNRYGCDTWTDPELFHLDWQAGAPPDDFAVKGQNWGFPTYNWEKMQENHFDWWRKRFTQMNNNFDAFRIDHILGFFRIWSIPDHAMEGIMGRFVPAIPISITEFGENGILFDYHRFCQPFITDAVLIEIFGMLTSKIKTEFMIQNSHGSYDLKPEFATQKKVEKLFAEKEPTEENNIIKSGLFDLISNVILFEEPDSGREKFHFRIAVDKTSSFRSLDQDQQQKIVALYINYFYYRQDKFWMREALKKLPYLKQATDMLICGEDLGMVPDCVPAVMEQLGILSLEIQRMPKKPDTDFINLKEAPYLSVASPSTHDMSTIRGWWEENKTSIAHYFNHELEQWGYPPYYCEPWINRAIVLQHLFSPAMWSIFQLQDLLGMSETLRRENPHEERINVPADPNNKWKYRMHFSLEYLNRQKKFNEELKEYVKSSSR